jgi:hypothetical protein
MAGIVFQVFPLLCTKCNLKITLRKALKNSMRSMLCDIVMLLDAGPDSGGIPILA